MQPAKTLIIILFLLAIGCGNGGSSAPGTSPSQEFHYICPSSGYCIDHPDTPQTTTGALTISYSIDLGATPKDLFFVFTASGDIPPSESPQVSREQAGQKPKATESFADLAPAFAPAPASRPRGIRGTRETDIFNNHPPTLLPRKPAGAARFLFSAPNPLATADTVGGTARDFYVDNSPVPRISATCRKISTDGLRTLNIWVADNAWDDGGSGCALARCVNQTMVDQMADRFVLTGADNDIREWVSNIFGEEWGSHSYSNLIPPTNEITILLFDIDGDNSSNGGVLGYYHAKDNYLNSPPDIYSNERLMFYLDSVLFASEEGSGWDLTDYWPKEVIGALAHEYQHMIHFYQKQVKNGLGATSLWLNEMSSEMAEEFIACKAGINGPRGVSAGDGSAGPPGNIYGRLPRFDRFDYLPFTDWMSGSINDPGDSNILNSYAASYAYGAFLARNFGGATLFRDLVQNDQTGTAAVDAALAAVGYGDETFASTLRKWGAAVLISDDDSGAVPSRYRYNNGGFFSSAIDGIIYPIGSINLMNYQFGSQIGPRVYTSLPPSDTGAGTYRNANLYYLAAKGQSGLLTRTITLPAGTSLTVVAR